MESTIAQRQNLQSQISSKSKLVLSKQKEVDGLKLEINQLKRIRLALQKQN